MDQRSLQFAVAADAELAPIYHTKMLFTVFRICQKIMKTYFAMLNLGSNNAKEYGE